MLQVLLPDIANPHGLLGNLLSVGELDKDGVKSEILWRKSLKVINEFTVDYNM